MMGGITEGGIASLGNAYGGDVKVMEETLCPSYRCVGFSFLFDYHEAYIKFVFPYYFSM